jgi:hypothetical protein
MAFRLQEINAADEAAVVGEDGDIFSWHIALKSGDLRRLDNDGVDHELLTKLALPLVAEMRRSKNAKSPCNSAIIPASIVLPTPTSSAISSLTGSSRRAMMSGTNW